MLKAESVFTGKRLWINHYGTFMPGAFNGFR
jgi:hypothetical protein